MIDPRDCPVSIETREPLPPRRDPSEVIAEMKATRLVPRSVRSHDMAPVEVRLHYERLWQAEHGAILAREAAEQRMPDHVPIGRLRRAWRALWRGR